jgi:hypothetical protein
LLTIGTVSVFGLNGLAWSNGGYSVDPDNPDYGTHDWIAQHALDWLPTEEKMYVLSNSEDYSYGTELPDNGNTTYGMGDTRLHHIYFNSEGFMLDDAAAVRANEEFNNTLFMLSFKDYKNASRSAGAMTHYIADMAVFAHVMGSKTPWGAETHHSDYEDYVNRDTSSYYAQFNSFLEFDGFLSETSPYDAAANLAYDTTFDNMTYTAIWMDQNYNWSNPTFVKRAGESLNLAVNYIADVLHSLYLKSEISGQPPSQPPSIPPSNPPSYWPTFPPVAIPLWTIGAAIVLIALIVVLAFTRSRPKQSKSKLVRLAKDSLNYLIFDG